MNLSVRTRTRRRKRPAIVAAAAVSVVAVLVAGLTYFALDGASEPPKSQEQAPIASPEPEPEPAPEPEPELPPSRAHVQANFAGWVESGGDLAGGTQFSAEVGSSPQGAISLRIDGLPSAGSAPQLSQIVSVQPETAYKFSMNVLSSGQADPEAGVSVVLGGAVGLVDTDLPTVTDGWRSLSMAYTTGPGETELSLQISPTGTLTEFLLGDISLVAAGSAGDILVNGSFTDFTAAVQITNSSLIMEKGAAAIGVSKRSAAINWAVSNAEGAPEAGGALDLASGLGVVPLTGLDQGMYSIELEGMGEADGPLKFSFLVLDDLQAASALDTRFGVGFHAARPYNEGVAESVAVLGFGSARTATNWGPTEVSPGEYVFPANQDEEIYELETSGVEVLPISGNGSNLYDGGQAPSSPAGIAAFSDYGRALVEHYGSPSVEIYNEFNWTNNKSACGATAACYLELLRPSVEKIKAASPGTKIVGPANALLDEKFMNELFSAGGLDLLDAVSFHPYDLALEGPESLIPTLDKANETIAVHNGGVSKPIWLTEHGYTASQISETDQANYIVRAQAVAFAHGVERHFWYDLVNDSVELADGEGNFGLLRQKSSIIPAFEPKPSAMTQAILTRMISNKVFSADESLDGNVFSYVFGAGETATRIVWAKESAEVRFETTKALTVTSAYGATTTVDPTEGFVTLLLDGEPVYVEGAEKPAVHAAASE